MKSLHVLVAILDYLNANKFQLLAMFLVAYLALDWLFLRKYYALETVFDERGFSAREQEDFIGEMTREASKRFYGGEPSLESRRTSESAPELAD